MPLTPLTPDCPDGVTCPAIRDTGRGTVIIQGSLLTGTDRAQITLGTGEEAAEIPARLLLEAARAYRG